MNETSKNAVKRRATSGPRKPKGQPAYRTPPHNNMMRDALLNAQKAKQ